MCLVLFEGPINALNERFIHSDSIPVSKNIIWFLNSWFLLMLLRSREVMNAKFLEYSVFPVDAYLALTSPVKLRMPQNFWSCCFCFLSAETTGFHHHTQFTVVLRIEVWICAEWISTLPTKIQPHMLDPLFFLFFHLSLPSPPSFFSFFPQSTLKSM